MDSAMTAHMEEQARYWNEKVSPVIDRLMAEDPGMPPVTAIVMAQDLAAVERSFEWMNGPNPVADRPLTFMEGYSFVGSYGRCEYIKQGLERGLIERAEVFKMLPDLWVNSDPDDTDPFWLDLFRDAKRANGRLHLTDSNARPHMNGLNQLTLYRGQLMDAKAGIAWTTDANIARKFALSGGGRMAREGGVVLKGKVHFKHILAYFTGRGESEVIVDPADVR